MKGITLTLPKESSGQKKNPFDEDPEENDMTSEVPLPETPPVRTRRSIREDAIASAHITTPQTATRKVTPQPRSYDTTTQPKKSKTPKPPRAAKKSLKKTGAPITTYVSAPSPVKIEKKTSGLIEKAPRKRFPWWAWAIIVVGLALIAAAFVFATRTIEGPVVEPVPVAPAGYTSVQTNEAKLTYVYSHRFSDKWTLSTDKTRLAPFYANSDNTAFALFELKDDLDNPALYTDAEAFRTFALDAGNPISGTNNLGGTTGVSEIGTNAEGGFTASVTYATGGDTGAISAVTIFNATNVSSQQIIATTIILANESGRRDYDQMIIAAEDTRN